MMKVRRLIAPVAILAALSALAYSQTANKKTLEERVTELELAARFTGERDTKVAELVNSTPRVYAGWHACDRAGYLKVADMGWSVYVVLATPLSSSWSPHWDSTKAGTSAVAFTDCKKGEQFGFVAVEDVSKRQVKVLPDLPAPPK